MLSLDVCLLHTSQPEVKLGLVLAFKNLLTSKKKREKEQNCIERFHSNFSERRLAYLYIYNLMY